MIAADLVPFLESGVTVLIGTRDDSLVPDCGRGLGARVDASREQVTVFVSDPLAGRTLENIRDNARIAVCFTRPEDHYSIQLKGRVLEAREATPDEDLVIERYRADLARTLAFIGLPTRLTMRLAIRPSWAIRFVVESIFAQTPGPGAGNPIGPRAGKEPA